MPSAEYMRSYRQRKAAEANDAPGLLKALRANLARCTEGELRQRLAIALNLVQRAYAAPQGNQDVDNGDLRKQRPFANFA